MPSTAMLPPDATFVPAMEATASLWLKASSTLMEAATAPALAAKMVGSAREAMVLRTRTSPVALTVPALPEAAFVRGSVPI